MKGIQGEFRDALIETLGRIGFDEFYGQRMEADIRFCLSMVDRDATVVTRRVRRLPGNYDSELLYRANELEGLANKLGCNAQAQVFRETLGYVDASGDPSTYSTPDLKVVVVDY